MTLSSKAKKSLLAVGSGVICLGTVLLIVSFSTAATAPDTNQTNSTDSTVTSVSVNVEDIQTISSVSPTEGNKVFDPSSGVSQTTDLTKIEKAPSTPQKPVVKGDASTASNGKTTPPTNSALTDKTKKPTYTSKPTATTSKPSSSAPSGGKPGQKYVPGFGWITAGNTPGETKTVSDAGGDINKQVGIMD
ncbi:DUF6550 family protein [Clostridium sp. KNHs216]|uniref:DUF6550 family protein n=1 Tax=Clostridium sp. KNHs216 TaxID=1550235 RepID=UPI00114D8D6A|nr:DUF6550 family protein [Clostridium sp. KNHs216]TQI68537.1 hypothetical protein LY85_3276 [Clostridium sp. KNHs216]